MKSILNKTFPVISAKDNNIVGFSQYSYSHKSFEPLGNRVIFQGFSFVIPMFNNEDESGLYEQVLPELKHLKEIGITDFWWPPPYKSLSLNEYKEGYAVSDRYDVGEFNQGGSTRTKYGTREQLEYALSYAHTKGLRNMADIVPNQMYFGSVTVGPCIWCSDNVNMSDALSFYNSFPTSKTDVVTSPRPVCNLNTAWAAGGGEGQQKYGLIPQFDYFHTNALNPSSSVMGNGAATGMFCVLRDSNYIPYRFYGNGDSRNYLPDWLQSAYDANNYITIQSTKTYLLINQGWVDFVHFIPYACYYKEEYDVTNLGTYSLNPYSGAQTNYAIPNVKGYSPDLRTGDYSDNSYCFKIQQQSFLNYLRNLPIDPSISTSTSDDDLIKWIKNYVGSEVGVQMSNWIAEQPGYGGRSVARSGFGYYTQTVTTVVTNTQSGTVVSNNAVTTYVDDYPYQIINSPSTTTTTSGNLTTTVTTVINYHESSWVVWNQNPSDDPKDVMENFMFDIITKNGSTYSSDIEGEFLLGTDINNENIDVLYDTVNWQKFLLNLGFDGFRFDAAGWYSNKVLTNSAILMSNLFGDDLTNHLSVLEDYGDAQVTSYLNSWSSNSDYSFINATSPMPTTTKVNMGYSGSVNFPQLSYDTASYYAMNSTVKSGFSSSTILLYFQQSAGGSRGAFSQYPPFDMDNTLLPSLKNSFIGGQFRGGGDAFSKLNWSFVNNHDMELNNQIKQYPTTDGTSNSTLPGLRNCSQQYCDDRRIRNKIKAHKNIVMSYAMMLINDFTVPSVYYGDMYDPHEPYMSVKSPFYAGIELCLRIRQRYAKGQQFNEFFIANIDLTTISGNTGAAVVKSQTGAVAMIRFGDDRDSGCVLVISTNENLSFTVTVPFGKFHANQTLVNVFGIEEYAQTDSGGNFDVFVTPVNTPITQGYMSLWIPI